MNSNCVHATFPNSRGRMWSGRRGRCQRHAVRRRSGERSSRPMRPVAVVDRTRSLIAESNRERIDPADRRRDSVSERRHCTTLDWYYKAGDARCQRSDDSLRYEVGRSGRRTRQRGPRAAAAPARCLLGGTELQRIYLLFLLRAIWQRAVPVQRASTGMYGARLADSESRRARRHPTLPTQ